jgi:hypothetical protein
LTHFPLKISALKELSASIYRWNSAPKLDWRLILPIRNPYLDKSRSVTHLK